MGLSTTVLITGSSGFIGGAVADFLKAKGASKILTPSRQELDLLDFNEVRKFVTSNKPNLVIHCASVLPISVDYNFARKMNNLIDRNIFNVVSESDDIRTIYTSGTSVYKKSFKTYTENSPIEANNAYVQSKIDGEIIFNSLGSRSVILRISAPYGNSQRVKTVIHQFINLAIKNKPLEIFGDGLRVQNFTYILDILQSIDLILYKNEISGIFNICSDESTSMRLLANTIISLTNSKSEILKKELNDPDDVTILNISNVKAKSELGWKCKFNLESGLKNMLDANRYNF